MRRSAVAVVLVLAVVLGGCGSGSDDSGAPVDLEDTRTEAQLAADTEAARAALPVLDDFPSGWSSEPRNDADEEQDPALDAELADCLGVDPALLGAAKVEVESDTFTRDDAEVEAEVSVLPTKAYADEAIDAIGKPQARGCLQAVFVSLMEADRDELPQGVTFGDVGVADLVVPDLGEDTVAFRVTMPIRVQLVALELFFDVVFVRAGRAIGTISFLDATTPLDRDVTTDVARTFASRLPES